MIGWIKILIYETVVIVSPGFQYASYKKSIIRCIFVELVCRKQGLTFISYIEKVYAEQRRCRR